MVGATGAQRLGIKTCAAKVHDLCGIGSRDRHACRPTDRAHVLWRFRATMLAIVAISPRIPRVVWRAFAVAILTVLGDHAWATDRKALLDTRVSTQNEICELARADRRHTPSQSCVNCHDGTVATGVEHRGITAGVGRRNGTHPVDVNFAQLRRLSRGRLRELAELPKALVLQDGIIVTCVTCHNGASQQPSHVAVPLSGSALCFSCHNR